MAGAASSGAFKAEFDHEASASCSPPAGLWMGALDMPPSTSGASAFRRQLIERFAKFDPRPKSVWLARSKGEAVIEFSTPAVSQRVFAALKGDKTQKFDYDLISSKGIQVFVDQLSEGDVAENPKRF